VWWALLPSAALFLPFGLSVIDRPRALLADPGVPLGFDAAPLWQQVLGQPLLFAPDGGLSGLPWFSGGAVPWAILLALLVAVPVLLLGVAALFLPGKRSGTARALWAAALIILVGGWLASHVATAASADTLVTPFTGPAVSAAGFALLAAALIGAERLLDAAHRSASRNASRSVALRAATAVAMVLLLAGPLAGMAVWSAQNVLRPAAPAQASDGPADAGLGTPRLVEAASARTLPATAIDRGTGPEQSRTLLISTHENGTFDAALMRGAGTTLDSLSAIAAARNIMGAPGQETIREDDDVTGSLRSVVATLVAGQGVDPRPELERLGAGFVVLRSADTAAQLTASRMDAVPGLVAVGQTDVGWLWRITPLNQPALQPADVAHRVRIVDPAGATVTLVPSKNDDVDSPVPAGPEGRLVTLAERADPGWSAWFDGQKLTSTTSGSAQAFTLPASAGQLTIRYDAPWALWSGIMQVTVFGLTVMLALPMPARRPNTGLSRDEGSLRKDHQYA
jgi:hypothetical protein